MAAISYLIAPVESPPRYGFDHEFGVDSPEFLARSRARPEFRSRAETASSCSTTATPSTRHAARNRRRADTRSPSKRISTGNGEIGARSRGACRTGAAGVQREDSARRHRVGKHRRGHSRGARSRRMPGRVVQPDPLVHARTVQQPHAPQVAHHRRRIGFTGGAGIADQWPGNAKTRALARHADSLEGPA